MRGPAEIRKRLESTSYPDLGTMMEGYAQAAVERGAGEFRAKLDFSSESVDALDEILVLVGESPELHGRRGRPGRVLQHGDGAAGKAGAGELKNRDQVSGVRFQFSGISERLAGSKRNPINSCLRTAA